MNRKLSSLLALVALAAAACSKAGLSVRPGEVADDAFRVLVADFEANAGPGLAMTSDADGNPHLAYLGLEEEPKPGEPPAAPPGIGEPVPPLVKHAHYVGAGWTRSVVAGEQDVDENVDRAAIAVDAGGTHHVAWTTGDVVRYASSGPEGFSEPVQVGDGALPHSLSITADADGTPWVAFIEQVGGEHAGTDIVRLASLEGEDWTLQTVAEASTDGSVPPATAVAAGPDGPLVAYGSEGATRLARKAGDIWESEIADESGGAGVSLALDADGNPHLAYLAGDASVRHAHSIDGSAWTTSEVGTDADPGSSTSIALDTEEIHHVAWGTSEGLGYATNDGGEFAEAEVPTAADGGTLPKLAAGPEGVVYLAWYDPEGTEVMLGVKGGEEPLLAVPTNAPTEAPTAPPTGPPPCEPDGTELTLTAPDGGVADGFTEDCLAAPAGEAFTVAFANQDVAPHNLGIYTVQGGDVLFKGDNVDAGASLTYQVDALEAGRYFFQCDIHPPTMTGQFVVQ